MEVNIKEDETVDDLQNGYRLIQKQDTFKFGVDAVLLADFAGVRPGDKAVELGTGTGVIAILVYAKKKPGSITAVEIQPDIADMAARSIMLNDLQQYIEVKCIDLREAPELLGKARYDCVITNPPYVRRSSGINNPQETKAISRFEIMCTLEDVVHSARELLRPGGKLFMVHRTDRLADIIYTMRSERVEPKRIRFVHPSPGKRPHLLLIEGARGGNPELKFMDPLYIYDGNGEYSEEIYRIYGRVK